MLIIRIVGGVVFAISVSVSSFAQTIPGLARAKPENPIVSGVVRDVPVLSIYELARGASLVVEGRISKETSYLPRIRPRSVR
jgi:hypothetical protein